MHVDTTAHVRSVPAVTYPDRADPSWPECPELRDGIACALLKLCELDRHDTKFPIESLVS